MGRSRTDRQRRVTRLPHVRRRCMPDAVRQPFEGEGMATIKDVASDAGVAVGTVSKVLNGQHVSAENKRKVEESVLRLGYQMDHYARGLKTRCTYTIAVIIPGIQNPFFSELVYHMEQELYRRGYKMYLCQSHQDPEKEADYLRLVCQNKVDGILGITFNETAAQLPDSIPMVMIDRHISDKICCVSSDNFQGGRLAAERLIAGGSSSLLFIRSGSNLSSETLKRGKGFEAMCREKKVPYAMLDVGDDTDFFNGEAIYGCLKERIHGGKPAFDGIYTSTDGLALIVQEQLVRLGIRVPEDAQLIGHDGLRKMYKKEYLVSSIAQPIAEMAKVSVEQVIKRIRKEPTEEMVTLPVTFVEGGTTRPPVSTGEDGRPWGR